MVSLLSGKKTLVTGTASGIGRAAALALIEQGATVLGLDIASPSSPVCPIIACDLSQEADVVAAVAAAAERLDGLDILVNCAGIEIDAPISGMTVADLDRMWQINVRGTMLVMREALPHLRKGASVVNIASELAYLGRAGASGYCATKGAMLSLTRSWARELGPDIRVNAVAPGPIDTPLLNFQAMSPELQNTETSNPLGRIGRPEEVAQVIAFLAGPGASYVTGQCYGADGGAAMR